MFKTSLDLIIIEIVIIQCYLLFYLCYEPRILFVSENIGP